MATERVARHSARRDRLVALRAAREAAAPFRVGRAESTVLPSDATDDVVYGEVLATTRRRSRKADIASEPVTVSVLEVDALLADLRKAWNAKQQAQLLASCRSAVLSSVAGPFGLGAMVARLDKDGGNVTTAHNASQGVFARDEERYVREDYAGSQYRAARDRYKDAAVIENSQLVLDEYSGDLLDYSEVDCDHIVPTETHHRSEGWRQSKAERTAFGADAGNFAMTSKNGNRSLKSSDKHEWQQKPATGKPDQINKDAHGHDNRRVNAAVERGRKTAAKHSVSTLGKSIYDGKRVAVTGAAEAGKLGLQQSIGLLLAEFFSASFDEISDSYHHGIINGVQAVGFVEALKLRLGRVVKRVATKWKDALASFKEGAISGLLSNIATWLINMVATTAKRMVRLIREGLVSILRALKAALFPPADQAPGEAADAALKLLATGITTSLGILAEEGLEKVVASFLPLAPFAKTISLVAIGALTGIASALVVAALDRLDLFGAQRRRRSAGVLKMLDALIVEGDKAIEASVQAEMGRTDAALARLYAG
ncbi:MAG: hypothetical protein E6Q67_08045 [Roseateles sp.]|nr:MAG: hypothetical protein E6Q67_08045 [Roseateles sp.]